MAYRITNECDGCTACVRLCPTGAIAGARKALHVINPSLCIECGACAIGAYDQEAMDATLRLDGENEFTVYIAPVGKRR